jgi:lipoprotein-anchoring transpeptidase ErfK/SrfK
MKTRNARVFVLACVVALLLGSLSPQLAFAENGQTYIVETGDTMLKIAARHGVNVNELAAANDLVWSSWVYVGQTLEIPTARDDLSRSAAEPAADPLFATDPRVLDPLPELPLRPLEQPATLVPFTYARVLQDDAPVYNSPADALQGADPKRTLGTGYVWVSLGGKVSYGDQEFYEVNEGEYVHAEAIGVYQPSAFQGVALAAGPERPFAWILKPVSPQLTPAGETNPEAPVLQRYDLVQVFATEHLGDQVWYLIGPHQWINQIYVGKVAAVERPEEIPAGAAWVEVDLFEQTLTAYVGDQMVYATLISSGLRGWDTPSGLFQVWQKFEWRKMSGGYNRPDYYFLEDVPWTLYFNRDVALHTAYWHDGFGYRRSHGCVNMAPLDARWLFEWAPDDLWVWVHGA